MIAKNKIYISGKITGVADGNQRKFNQAEHYLIFTEGPEATILNPHKLPHIHDKSWTSYMKEDLRYLLACTCVFALDDWKQSRGAVIEVLLADIVKIPVYEFTNYQTVPLTLGMSTKISLIVKLLLNRF